MHLNPFLGLYFIEVCGFFAIGLLVALRQRTTVYRYFASFAFLVGVWQFLQFMSQVFLTERELAVNLLRASVVAAGILAACFLLFARAYSGKKSNPWVVLLLGFVAGAFTLFSNSLKEIAITDQGIGVPRLDIWYGGFLVFAAMCIVLGLASIFMHYRQATTEKKRKQDRSILITTFIVGFIVISASFYTSDFSQTVFAQHILPLSCLGGMLSYLYAMTYHDLFDIHFFAVRAAAYLTTLFVIVLFCVAPLVVLTAKLLQLQPHPGAIALLSISIVLIIYGLQYMRLQFDRLTARVFFRNYYDPQDVLDELSSALVRNVNIDDLCKESGEILKKAIEPSTFRYTLLAASNRKESNLAHQLKVLSESVESPFKNVIIRDDIEDDNQFSRLLRRENVAAIVKLRTSHDDIGFILLGYKQSGEIYSTRDKRLLTIAADEIAIGLQNALHFREIERFNTTLQEKIEDATKRLRQTNIKLRTLDQTKDDFISMASHQLRTPLTSVKGYVSMVLDGDSGRISPLQRKLLNQAFVSSQRMVYLISDLLNLSRLRTGKFVIEPTPCNLADVIKGEIEQLVETAKARNLELTYHKPDHFPTYMLDETKLRQVIMNFVDNAIYYTPSGGIIDVYLAEKPSSIEFTVVDSGIGVPRHEQHHLFTKFYRAHNAKRARPDGTGLGLFMAKKVVIAQGGAIIFRSQEGKGSTFGFSFAKDRLQIPAQSAKTAGS
ncbi:MAG TPA: ATP-binding protein [Candidatus Saccharimonadales bacterium]|nr:ATP-binding protein [Candidatus Saccharimonadales bacterium]